MYISEYGRGFCVFSISFVDNQKKRFSINPVRNAYFPEFLRQFSSDAACLGPASTWVKYKSKVKAWDLVYLFKRSYNSVFDLGIDVIKYDCILQSTFNIFINFQICWTQKVQFFTYRPAQYFFLKQKKIISHLIFGKTMQLIHG